MTCDYCESKVDYFKKSNQNVLVYPVYDNHRIFVFYACNECEKEQKSKYDPVIFYDYKSYSQKVLENGERFD